MSLFDKTTNAIGTAMDMMTVRHNVVSSNIANAETPNYHAKRADFEKELKDLVKELEIIEDKRSWVYMTNNGPFKLLSEV